MQENLVYFLEGAAYINLTNACTNRCLFCVRDIKDDVVGARLWLENDNVKSQDVISQLDDVKDKIRDRIVFCGYGEPLLRLDVLKEVAKYIKENFSRVSVRVNTNGHACAVFKKNVASELVGLVDAVSISLNAESEELYNKISRPSIKDAYLHVKEFAKQCVEAGLDTTMSVVFGYPEQKIDVKKCEEIAQGLGAKFRAREWIKEGY